MDEFINEYNRITYITYIIYLPKDNKLLYCTYANVILCIIL